MTTCPCDEFVFPELPAIPPGLESLPRQTLTFPAARRHMLSLVPGKPALDGWRAREGDDLGVMLLEMWATLLDNLSFYDRELAQELYLGTARRRTSLRRLAALIGHRPRPAIAASATIAGRAGGAEPTLLPAGTAFRSDAFDGEPAQVFELGSDTEIHPPRNAWTVQRAREGAFVDELLLERGAQAPAAGDIVVVEYRESGGSGFSRSAIRVAATEPFPAPDGETYTRIVPEEIYTPPSGALLSELALHLVTQTANPTPHTQPLTAAYAIVSSSPEDDGGLGAEIRELDPVQLVLDALYPQIQPGDGVVIEYGSGALLATEVLEVATVSVQILSDSNALVPATRVTLDVLAAAYTSVALPQIARLHFATVPLGALVNPYETTLQPEQLDGSVALDGVYPDLSTTPSSGRLLVKGAGDAAYELPGSVSVDSRGRGTGSVDGSAIEEALRTDVALHGNLLDLTRGETVRDELLGSADSKVAFQEFALKKKPLTYVTDASLAAGIRPELEVRVDGILWTRVETLAEAGPGDEVYAVRIGDDETASVRFGDLVRPATGARITATYRHGAGAARPPLGAIKKVVGNVAGLDRVLWSLAARGGDDREAAETIRSAAPAATLTLGRAVSLPDFEAIAASFPGVVTTAADMAWSTKRHRVAVTVWIVSDGGSVAGDLAPYLAERSDPEVLVEVVEADPVDASLAVEVIADARYSAELVAADVLAALTDSEAGFLTPAALGIGRPLFHSALVKAIHAVPGVAAIRALTQTPPGGPVGLEVVPGTFLDFADVTVDASK